MKNIYIRSIISPIICLALTSCRSVEPATSSEKFIGGEQASAGMFPSLVRFGTFSAGGGQYYCGAGKIGPRRFLTAAHCLMAGDSSPGSSVALFFGTEFYALKVISAKITSSVLHNINLAGQNSASFGFDVAVFDIDIDTPQIAVATVSTKPVSVGDLIVVSGYGCEGDTITTRPPGRLGASDGNLRFGKLKVLSIEANHLYFDRFDQNGTEARVCVGDSGTPAYLPTPGKGFNTIIGVNSYRSVTGTKKIWSAVTRFDQNLPQESLTWLRQNQVIR